jgi:hypothetical protein
MEATRLIELHLSLVDPGSSPQLTKEYAQLDEGLASLGGPESRREGRRKCQELPENDDEDSLSEEYPSSDHPGKGKRRAISPAETWDDLSDDSLEEREDPYPPLYFRGLSKGVHGSEATVLGSIRMGTDGVVRWRFVSHALSNLHLYGLNILTLGAEGLSA